MQTLQSQPDSNPFYPMIQTQIEQCIKGEENPYTADTRGEMLAILQALQKDGYYVREGTDDFRAPFVGLQGIFEHVLAAAKANGAAARIFGAIHTPTPTTPLCVPLDQKDVANLLAPSIRDNQDKQTTVSQRALSIRKMLAGPDTLIYAIYPQGGLAKRTETEQATFLEEASKNEASLRISELECEKMDPSMIGAIYLFADTENHGYAFSIKAQQANAPLENSTWGLWLGSLEDPQVRQRIEEVSKYLAPLGGPDLLSEFESSPAASQGGAQIASSASKAETPK